jgi:galactose mutarotase-like enzyme
MSEYGRQMTLKNSRTEISVAPDLGFSLVSLRWRGLEILDTRTNSDFLAFRKGLGPLILPHFNQYAAIPRIDKHLFPHVEALEARGVGHPFQHGVGRYVTWECRADGDSIRGSINGARRFKGYSLSELTGYDFSASVIYTLADDGLEIAFDLQGDQAVAAGIHFYYNLFDKARATVLLPDCSEAGPARLSLSEPLDKAFALKAADRTEAVCTLKTGRYTLMTRFPAGGEPETVFDTLVVFCPSGGGFACIEPISYPVGEANTKKHFQGSIRLQLAGPVAG